MSSAKVSAAYTCMEQYCSTASPGDPSGQLVGSTDCLTNSCSAQLGALLFGAPQCFDCVIDYASSYQPWGSSQNTCTTAAQPPFGFGGQVSQLILSKYPLLDSDSFILPSTNFRQAVLYSRVQLEDQQVDFYCSFFTSTLVAGSIPYEGFYGAGGDIHSSQTGGAYANEQLLQAQDLIAWVKKKSNGKPAIIVGDWRASQLYGDGGVPPLDSGLFAQPTDLVPGTLTALGSAFTAVAAPAPPQGNWTPQCTYCPGTDNPLNAGQPNGWFMTQPFLSNWPQAANSVTDEKLIYTDLTVPGGADAGLVPPSQYYGINFKVQRP